jgi:hypothetical protein
MTDLHDAEDTRHTAQIDSVGRLFAAVVRLRSRFAIRPSSRVLIHPPDPVEGLLIHKAGNPNYVDECLVLGGERTFGLICFVTRLRRQRSTECHG